MSIGLEIEFILHTCCSHRSYLLLLLLLVFRRVRLARLFPPPSRLLLLQINETKLFFDHLSLMVKHIATTTTTNQWAGQ